MCIHTYIYMYVYICIYIFISRAAHRWQEQWCKSIDRARRGLGDERVEYYRRVKRVWCLHRLCGVLIDARQDSSGEHALVDAVACCGLEHATCNMQDTTYSMQQTTYSTTAVASMRWSYRYRRLLAGGVELSQSKHKAIRRESGQEERALWIGAD